MCKANCRNASSCPDMRLECVVVFVALFPEFGEVTVVVMIG